MTLVAARLSGNTRLQAAARNSPVMKRGERGRAVEILQTALADLNYQFPDSTLPNGMLDGKFGKETYAVVRSFQTNHCLKVDGLVGKQTLGKLDRIFEARAVPSSRDKSTPSAACPSLPRNARFKPAKPLQGFCSRSNPDWQMVPLRGKRRVFLYGGENLNVVSEHSSIASVHEVPRYQPVPFNTVLAPREFIIEGHLKADTTILAMQGRRVAARLQVSVKQNLSKKVAYHYVKDRARHATVRRVADLATTLKVAQTLFFDQANITIHKHSARELFVNADLGDPITDDNSNGQSQYQKLVRKRDISADFNVFFVWNYEGDSSGEEVAEASTRYNMIVLEDDLTGLPFWHVLTHELGHLFGLEHSKNDDDVMTEGSSGTLNVVPRRHINIMNP